MKGSNHATDVSTAVCVADDGDWATMMCVVLGAIRVGPQLLMMVAAAALFSTGRVRCTAARLPSTLEIVTEPPPFCRKVVESTNIGPFCTAIRAFAPAPNEAEASASANDGAAK